MKLPLSLFFSGVALYAIAAHAADVSTESEQVPEKRFYAWDGGDPSPAKRKCVTKELVVAQD